MFCKNKQDKENLTLLFRLQKHTCSKNAQKGKYKFHISSGGLTLKCNNDIKSEDCNLYQNDNL